MSLSMWIVPMNWIEFLELPNHVTLFVLIVGFFATLVQILFGRPFYRNAYKSLKHKSPNMDVLITLGTSSALIYSLVMVGVGYEESDDYMEPRMEHMHFFETASALIVIVLVGKFMEIYTKKKTLDKLF